MTTRLKREGARCHSRAGVLNLWRIPHLWGMASCQVGNFAFTFWATMYGSYPHVAVAALTLLVAFPSTYLCESAFSSMVQIKTKSPDWP